MAINTVTITLNGQDYQAAYNSATGRWEASVPAPATTSARLPGGFYPVSILALTDGDYAIASTATPEWAEALRLVVTESVQPGILVLSPQADGFSSSKRPPVTIELRDDELGSGIDLASFTLKLDSSSYTSASPGMAVTPVGHGYDVVYTPQADLSDGAHTITVNVRDVDGNAAETLTQSFTVDTVLPTLTVETPQNGQSTALESTVVRGVMTDAVTTVQGWVELDGAWFNDLRIREGGRYSLIVPLHVGAHTVTVIAQDEAGNRRTQSLAITRTYDFAVITDRTEEDLARATYLNGRNVTELTAAERAELLAGPRGAYGFTDLNRVETDVRWLRDYLAELGRVVLANPKEDWTRYDIPRAADMIRYLAQVKLFTEQFPAWLSPLPLPERIGESEPGAEDGLSIEGANEIERYLAAVLHYIELYRRGMLYYAGDLYAGEI